MPLFFVFKISDQELCMQEFTRTLAHSKCPLWAESLACMLKESSRFAQKGDFDPVAHRMQHHPIPTKAYFALKRPHRLMLKCCEKGCPWLAWVDLNSVCLQAKVLIEGVPTFLLSPELPWASRCSCYVGHMILCMNHKPSGEAIVAICQWLPLCLITASVAKSIPVKPHLI